MRICGACGTESRFEPGAMAEARPCPCGALLPPTSTAAGMLHCPHCGAPVPRGADRCDHCAVHLKTLRCPACFARAFVGSRHCEGCGAGLAIFDTWKQLSAACPRCNEPLNGQRLGDAPAATCTECGGLWLEHATFAKLRAERESRAKGLPPRAAPRPVTSTAPDRYLKCPMCPQLMNRSNFGRISGVLVDSCREHGIWFDADELEEVFAFIAEGGLERAARRDAERERERLRAAKFDATLEALAPPTSSYLAADTRPRRSRSLLSILFTLIDG